MSDKNLRSKEIQLAVLVKKSSYIIQFFIKNSENNDIDTLIL